MSKVNEDLMKERNRCSFDVNELTYLLDGDEAKTKERRRIEEALMVEELYTCLPEPYLSYKETLEHAIKKTTKIVRLVLQERENGGLNTYRDVLEMLLASPLNQGGSPLGVHFIMFMPSLLGHGTPEQQEQWLTRAWNCNIIGSFAQTELGHGTFIRGLETTAIYDELTKEFVLNTPTLTSYKWWPGGLGHSVNYCIIMAQLYIKGQCVGIHPFMLQVRDEETHLPLKGIKIGDIGPKMGFNSVNNGYLGLDNVRIPRTNMLMKHAQVLEDGTYVKSPSSKLTYSTMVFVRVVIVFDTCNYLTKAVTVATRYSAVRRQSQIKDSEPEVQILDFLTQQHKIFISIAACHAQKLTASWLWKVHAAATKRMQEGDLETLPELHALACCLKAVCTADTASYVEQCRLACGGHGYMHSSMLPAIYAQVTAACTYEGENTVLLLQTARYLTKAWQSDSAGTATLKYLKVIGASPPPWGNTLDGIIQGMHVVAARKIASASQRIQSRVASGMSYEDAWNMCSVQLTDAAESYCRVIIITKYKEETELLINKSSRELQVVLKQLVELYTLYWSLRKMNDLLRYTIICDKDIEYLQNWYEELLLKIRPNAVGLVDAFDIRDEILNSTLGSWDGQVYERLMKEALRCPLNQEPVNDSFHKYLKPFMNGKL